ncbi:hypothetical protein VPBG_00141 [Vibrio phage helene 12B3]|uniref:hypothetical protein n=1 Tax=Vibrio phage helene 12B3 TaxID=573173 RepID=UPI0002C101A4|nr:hypothetical protein VPBG_00141 [Vibrio phage helene 12B3]YP_009223010.1 hypothetical protein VPLG_00161 [Vibrio phage eugene 12A10]AGG57913.1 hypothetical protein VPBG_00141 [Vibrio phage helene 12B3]AGN51600.1 hypothetical protein VPLG_00161 [Vibrio phage eugene 12A10]
MKTVPVVLEKIDTISVLDPPKITIVFVIDKPKEYVRELMLGSKGNHTITYYLPINSCPVEDVPDYSNTWDWRIEGKSYTVDLMQPQWHPDAESVVEYCRDVYEKILGINNFVIVR